MFFFVSYNGYRDRRETASVLTSIPTLAQRNGDFSALPVVIYDPRTTRPNPAGTGFIRDPFPGNRIPATRLSPVGLALARFWPLPNVEPLNPFTQSNNYTLGGAVPNDADRIYSRVGDVFSRRWRMFARYSFSNERSSPFNSFQNPASSAGGDGPTFTRTNSLSIDHTYTIDSTLVIDLRYGLNRRHLDRSPPW